MNTKLYKPVAAVIALAMLMVITACGQEAPVQTTVAATTAAAAEATTTAAAADTTTTAAEAESTTTAAVVTTTAAVATTTAAATVPDESDLPLLKYTYINVRNASRPDSVVDDIITPWLENKFKIEAEIVTYGEGQPAKERLNMLIAAGNLPDVILLGNPDLPWFVGLGAAKDLDPYLEHIPLMRKWCSELGWKQLRVNGAVYGLPSYGLPNMDDPEIAALVDDSVAKGYMSNEWPLGGTVHCLANEWLLEQAGYKFKTIAQLQAELDATGRAVTFDDVQLDPPINNIDDFEVLLSKLAELKTEGGLNIIPYSINTSAFLHIQTKFNPASQWWRNPATKEVSGYIGHPWSRETFRDLIGWIHKGWLDPESLVHTNDQIQEKVASGRAALFFFAPNVIAAREAIREAHPGYDIRPMPAFESKYGHLYGYTKSAVDGILPNGFSTFSINKDFTETERLLDYFDYIWSEEFLDIVTWGPEEAGLWEIRDGQRQFKDDTLIRYFALGTKRDDGISASYYGLWDQPNMFGYPSHANFCAPAPSFNYKTYTNYYPPITDARIAMFKANNVEYRSLDGTVLTSGFDEITNEPTNFWNTEFRTNGIAELIGARDDAEFDEIWDKWLYLFETEGRYLEAIPLMEARYAELLD